MSTRTFATPEEELDYYKTLAWQWSQIAEGRERNLHMLDARVIKLEKERNLLKTNLALQTARAERAELRYESLERRARIQRETG